MQQDSTNTTPQAPETQTADVREQLHQENISKVGDVRDASDAGATPSSHFGAVEDDMTGHSDQQVVTPPMNGPYNLIEGDEDQDKSADVDPEDEIVGGG
jgi:hypothetical protein